MIKSNIIIIGAGASGLMFASTSSDKDFVIIESNKSIGVKIQVSGGGKCNLTNKNINVSNFLGSATFIKPALLNFTNKNTLEFFKDIPLVVRNSSQYFCKNSAKDVLNKFSNSIDIKNIYFEHLVTDVEFKDGYFTVITNRDKFQAKKLIVASGGVSFKEIGASDIGYKIAKSFGHDIVSVKPALVGLTLQKNEFWMKKLSGISFKAKVTLKDKIFIDELLFTYKGISGPLVLNTSVYWEKGTIILDFLPNSELKFDYPNRQISSNLKLPKRFIKEFLDSIGLEDKKVSLLTKEELKKLSKIKNYEFAPAGDFGYKKAEVTKGGIDTSDIDPYTMQSRFQDGLYFIGECLDVTGELGGYNFQWAFSSANMVKI